jgi:sortase (surface protein transpeptidase)
MSLGFSACQVNLAPTPTPVVAEESATVVVQAMAPLPLLQAVSPTQLAIPALNLELPIAPMGWSIVERHGQRTTEWMSPTDAVGWHVTSAGAGAAGRVVLSGHQVQGRAPLAPLAVGALTVGQELLLTDNEGIVFVYRVIEVTEPLPLTGATADEEAQAASYVAPSDQALLTIITGWPDFTTTHRLFAVAELVGLQK